MYNIFSGMCLIVLSFLYYKTGIFSPSWGGVSFELGIIKVPLSLSLLILGLYLIVSYKKVESQNLDKKEIYTICPKCKETFDYKDLKNGKCPHCKDIDTVDIEKYYKDKKEQEKETKIDKEKKDIIDDETN